MSQLNDCEVAALVAQGYSGSRNDMMLAWAQANGGTSNQLNDALYEMLGLQGGTGALNDRWYSALGLLGLTGALNDRKLQFWCDLAGTFSFAAIRLQCYTDPSAFCVVFSDEVEPTSSPTLGVSVTVNAVGSAFNASITGNQICYTFVDPDLLVEGSEVIWAYDGPFDDGGSGNIRSTSDEYAAAKTLTCSIPYSSTSFQTGFTAGVLCEAA